MAGNIDSPSINKSSPSTTQNSVRENGRFKNPWASFYLPSVCDFCELMCCAICLRKKRGPWPSKEVIILAIYLGIHDHLFIKLLLLL